MVVGDAKKKISEKYLNQILGETGYVGGYGKFGANELSDELFATQRVFEILYMETILNDLGDQFICEYYGTAEITKKIIDYAKTSENLDWDYKDTLIEVERVLGINLEK